MSADSQQPKALPHPLVVLAASFALGILLARFTRLPLNLALGCSAACSLIALYSFIKRQMLFASLALALAFFGAGAALMRLEESRTGRERIERIYDEGLIASGDPVEVQGVATRSPEPTPDGFYLTLNVERIRFKETERAASGQVLFFAPVRDAGVRAEYEALELRYGARVSVMCALDRAARFRNPGVSTVSEYLEQQGIDATSIIKSPLLVERLDDERVFLPLAWVYEWRQRLLALIDEKFSSETSGVLDAALLGNRYLLSKTTAERFREGGTFHLLVISGLHIGFIGALIFFLVRRITKRRAWQFIISVTLLWTYAIAVGARISVVRAALMFTIVALAPVLNRRARSLNALGFAALLLLIWRPPDLFDPSFQLTFISVLGIIVLAVPLLEKLRNIGAWHPTRETPYPPACPRWLRTFCEALFWSERAWRREMARANYSYRLFKTPLAARLESFHVQRLLRFAFNLIIISASVQLALLPLLVLHFHRLSLAALILNIWVGALMALLGLIALLALLLSQLSAPLAAPLFKLAEGLNWLMVHSVDPFAQAHLASIRLPHYTGWPFIIYILYYVPLVLLAVGLARWNPFRPIADLGEQMAESRKRQAVNSATLSVPAFRLVPSAFCFLQSACGNPQSAIGMAAIGVAIMFALIVFHPLSAGRPDGRLRIDFLDVGQGDAALMTMPDGTTLLIDGGGRTQTHSARQSQVSDEPDDIFGLDPFERDSRSIGEAVVSEYLWWRGLDTVDYILATHADADHINGLNDVARNFIVRTAIVGRAPANDPEFAQFAATARRNDVPVRIVGRGDVFHFGAVEAEVLWPPRTDDVNAPSRNNDSVVLRFSFGNRVFLMTGDIEKDAEAALVSAPDDLRSDVVKVAHHGSHTSSTQAFINATQPTYAIISVGLTSNFGHPHADVLERWCASQAQIMTTGQRGTVTISTDGNDLRVETFVK